MTVSTSEQLAKVTAKRDEMAAEISLPGNPEGWRYSPPASDDPKTWTGLLRWCYAERVYRWCDERVTLLKGGGGPYYCGEHGEQPREGWQELSCLRCSWGGWLYEDTMAMARDLGRPYRGKVAEDGSWKDYVTQSSEANREAA